MAESNYEKMKRACAQAFCETDHKALIERFGLKHDGSYLYLQFFNQPFRLSKKTGAIDQLRESASSENDTWREAQFDESMTIYDLLSYAQPTCHASGQIVNMKSLHMSMAATAPQPDGFYAPQEARFASFEACQRGILAHAAKNLGGTPLDKADASAQFTVIDDLAMQIHLWLPDEDFPASIQFYWDENALQYMHYETVWYANEFILGELEERCRKLLEAELPTMHRGASHLSAQRAGVRR